MEKNLFLILFLMCLNPLCYYVTNTYENFWTKFCHIPKMLSSTVLCLRFPFLYPRNRFTGTHWYWYRFREYYLEIRASSIAFKGEIGNKDNPYHMVIVDPLEYKYYRFLEFLHDYVLQIFHCIPTYTELDSMPKGWRKAFGEDMCKEIRSELLNTGYSLREVIKIFFSITISARSLRNKMYQYKRVWKNSGIYHLYSYRILDIKEKYGGLRWYDAQSTRRVLKIIDKYENISYKTCIHCGKQAEWETRGWISPYCDKCISRENYKTDKIIVKDRKYANDEGFEALAHLQTKLNKCINDKQINDILLDSYKSIDKEIVTFKNKLPWYLRILGNNVIEDIRMSLYDVVSKMYYEKEKKLYEQNNSTIL